MIPNVTESEIEEVILFLRKSGNSNFANRIEALKLVEKIGREQYLAGVDAILAVERAMKEPVARNLILGRISFIIEEIKKVL